MFGLERPRAGRRAQPHIRPVAPCAAASLRNAALMLTSVKPFHGYSRKLPPIS